MGTDFDNLKAIFLAAVERTSPAERTAFLDEACAANAALREGVDALLAAHAQTGALLDRAPVEPPATAAFEPIQEQSGAVIGPYKLLQQIGEGGMGLVFMAEQQRPLKRKVALKIIKPGMDSKQVVARFEAERQILALMSHPHIAQVLDAGTTESGRPFFVMELVRGVPITEYCDQHNLTPRERLELFVSVCYAVQHAHQKGIIHRDIKPTNVLVTLHDSHPVPKIIDFGVAKALNQEVTERTLFTNFAQMVGTPLYMSPEQAEMSGLDIDTRADIYSLGVLLYELLTGQTPFDKVRLREAAYDEVRRIIREEEPPRPSTRLSTLGDALSAISLHRKTDPRRLGQLIRGDLDWIVMKSLDKDRTRRYETASEFAGDVLRHLQNEPVAASPPSVRYRLQKLARKHRGLLAFISLVLFCQSCVSVVSVTLYHRAERLRGAALDAKADAVQARQAETRRAGELEQALGAVTAERNLKNEALAARDQELLRSEALRLTTHSTATLQQDPGLALLLASEAAERAPRLGAVNDALRAALTNCREVHTLSVQPLVVEGTESSPAVTAVAYSRDGQRLLTRSSATIRQRVVVNTATDLLRAFQGSPSLSSELTVRVGIAQLWEPASGRLVATIQAPPNLQFLTVELSPDRKLVAATFDSSTLVKYAGGDTHYYTDRVARVYDAESGQERFILRGHTLHLVAATFSADSQFLLTASHDGTARLWNLSTGEQVPDRMVTGKAGFEGALFNPAGNQFLTREGINEYQTEYLDGMESAAGQSAGWKVDPPAGNVAVVRDLNSGTGTSSSQGVSASVSLGGLLAGFLSGTAPSLHLWDAASGQELSASLLIFSEDGPEVAAVAQFDASGRRFAGGGTAGTIMVWQTASPGTSVRFRPRPGVTIRSLQFSSDDQWLLVGYADDGFLILNAQTGEQVSQAAEPPRLATAMAFGSDGRLFVVPVAGIGAAPTSGNGELSSPATRTVLILDAVTLHKTGVLRGHAGDVNTVCVSPDGQRCVTAANDGTARIWKADGFLSDELVIRRPPAPALAAEPAGGAAVQVSAPVLSADGQFVLVPTDEAFRRGESASVASLYRTSDGGLVSHLTPDNPRMSPFAKEGWGGLLAVDYSADLRRLVTVSAERRVRLLKLGTSLFSLFATPIDEWPTSEELPFRPVRVWDVATGKECAVLQGLNMPIASAAFSPDGRRLVTRPAVTESYSVVKPHDGQVVGTGSNSFRPPDLPLLQVWNVEDGRLLFTLRDTLNPGLDWAGDLQWRADSKGILAANLPGWVFLDEPKLLRLPVNGESHYLPDPGMLRLLAHGPSQALLFDLAAGQPKSAAAQPCELVSHNADGSQASLESWPCEDLACPSVPLAGQPAPLVAAAFSPNGRWLAGTTQNHRVLIWNVADGSVIHDLRGHAAAITAATFSADSRRLVTASDDGTARVWDLDLGTTVMTLQGHRGPVRSAVFGADDEYIVTSSTDGTARTWATDLLTLAQARRPRELSPDERARFELGEGSSLQARSASK